MVVKILRKAPIFELQKAGLLNRKKNFRPFGAAMQTKAGYDPKICKSQNRVFVAPNFLAIIQCHSMEIPQSFE
jgi:hypothetical protein